MLRTGRNHSKRVVLCKQERGQRCWEAFASAGKGLLRNGKVDTPRCGHRRTTAPEHTSTTRVRASPEAGGRDMGRDCGETRTRHGGDTAEAQDGDAQDQRKRRRDRHDHSSDHSRTKEADAAGAHGQRRRKTPGRSGEKKRRQKRKVAETEKGRLSTGHTRSRCASDGHNTKFRTTASRAERTAHNTHDKAIPIRVSLLQGKCRQCSAHRRCRSPASMREPFRWEGRQGGCERLCLLLPMVQSYCVK